MHLNLVDVAIVAVFALAVLDGVRRGFVPYATELVAFGLSLAAALAAFKPLAALLRDYAHAPVGLTSVGVFLAILVSGHGLVLAAVGRWTGRPLKALLAIAGPRAGRAAGAVPAFGTALALSALILSATLALPSPPPVRGMIRTSMVASAITQKSGFIQAPIRDLLAPAGRESQNLPDSSACDLSGGEDAFCPLQLPAELLVEPDLGAEDTMLQRVNETRAKAEPPLPALKLDAQLTAAAREHSKDMFQRKYFSHLTPDRKQPFDRMRANGVKFVSAGENIAYAANVEGAEASLMSSADHRANILNRDFRRIGIGVFQASFGGRSYSEMFTQEFADS